MSLERIGGHFYTVGKDKVIDSVPIGVIAETCVFAALRQGLDGVLEGSTINDLIQDEWTGSRFPEKDIRAIRPTYKKMLKRAIAALQAHEEEVM